MCCPVLKGACEYADVIFLDVNCWFFVVFRCFFSRLDFVGQLLSAHETHITSTTIHTTLFYPRLGRMASCGPPPPSAAATPAAAAATAAARPAATPGAAAIHAAATPSIEQR